MTNTMKHSGIPWIGDIPSHWEVKLIKWIMRNKSIKGCPTEQVLSLYREYGVVPKDSRNDNHNVTSEDTSTYKFVDVGDFVINKMKAWQGSMAVSDYQGIISPAYYICEFITENISKRYIHYLLRNETYKAEYLRLSTGLRVGQWDLNIDDFLHIPIVVPPPSEQKAIADYLDKHCAEVDEMVSLQEKIIEELREYRQAIITETVTRGLNPNAPMKDSRVEWIGQIPVGWEIKRLKNLFALQTGTTPDNYEEQSDENVWWFTPSDVTEEGNVIIKSERVLSKKNIVEQKIALFPIGSLIFVGIGASAGKLGYAAIEGYSNQQITALIPKKNNICSKYFFYFMCADKKRLKDNAFYTTLPIISNSYLAQNLIISPTLSDQQAIADYLDKKTAEIDQLILIKQQKIEELKEYKKSLIYEYVTGKKEVDG